MKPEKINQLIAEHCPEKFGVHKESGEVFRWLDEEGIHIETIDFCSDLNAIMEAVKEVILGDMDLEQAFVDSLNASLDARADDDSGPVIYLMEMAMITADPGEFCEAFLRAVKKWEDE